jgi:hypothetical protein
MPVPSGSFAGWMKKRGKLGGQNKVPRIITNREMLAELISFAQSPESGTLNTGSAAQGSN